MFRYLALFLFLPLITAADWHAELAKMPLNGGGAELTRMDTIPRILKSFNRNPAVKGLVFMPGATDEFYFFKRAQVKLTNSQPNLLEVITALTNQTSIRLKYEAPFLILHTVEDPSPMIIDVKHENTAAKLRQNHYTRELLYIDKDWDTAYRSIRYNLNVRLEPPPKSHESNHFFRYHIAAYDLTRWDAIQALCLSGKTKVAIEKNKVIFDSDTRIKGRPSLDGIRTFE